MQLITSHLNTDFDSLASMVAIKKFYPDAVICPPGAVSRRVRDFLNRYGHLWTIRKPGKIPMEEVTLMVVVDTCSRSRVGPFAALVGRPEVEVHVYDHHPLPEDEIPADKKVVDPLGATVTLIAERIFRDRVPVSPEEATLFSTGIYDDTGALTYESTTERDILVLARLRQLGADLSNVLARVEVAMPAKERHLLDELVENARESYINGAKVVFAWADTEEYIEGLALFVHRLRDHFDSHVTLAAVRCARKTWLIVRSAQHVLDVRDFLTGYGGSGHLQAGSAVLPDRDPRELLAEIEEQLCGRIRSMGKVESIMTSPVMAVSPDSGVDEVYRTMLRFGHQALPVVRDGELLGIMTRKDLDKAYLHGFERASISEFMTEGVIAISAEASHDEAHRLMATYSFERLPVLKNGVLVGIVTRADLIRALYQMSRGAGERDAGDGFLWMEGASELMESAFSPGETDLLRRIGEKAESLGMRAYIVGGAVRDILRGEKNIDIDIAVEGDAEILVRSWDEPGCRATVHGRYKTGTITFPDGVKVDIVTARREFYEYAAAMPKVSSDSLKQDLARRDFTINAMAVSLSADDWGTLTDFYGGRRDLKDGLLRVLHNLSFVEDPTRVLRGVRLEQRMDLRFEDNTLRLLRSAISGELLKRLSGSRIRTELEISFRESTPKKIGVRMQELGIWESLFPGLRFNTVVSKRMGRLQAMLPVTKKAGLPLKGTEWMGFIAALLSESPLSVRSSVADRLNFTPAERQTIYDCLVTAGSLERFFGSKKSPKNSEIFRLLKKHTPLTLLYCAAATRRRQIRRWIARYTLVLSSIRGELTGEDLKRAGCPPGPALGQTLEEIRMKRMDGEIVTQEDELRYVREKLSREEEKNNGGKFV